MKGSLRRFLWILQGVLGSPEEGLGVSLWGVPEGISEGSLRGFLRGVLVDSWGIPRGVFERSLRGPEDDPEGSLWLEWEFLGVTQLPCRHRLGVPPLRWRTRRIESQSCSV